jgi:hypothetical protein
MYVQAQIAPAPATESWFSRNLDLVLMIFGALAWAIWKQKGAGLALIVAGLLVRIRDSGELSAVTSSSSDPGMVYTLGTFTP